MTVPVDASATSATPLSPSAAGVGHADSLPITVNGTGWRGWVRRRPVQIAIAIVAVGGLVWWFAPRANAEANAITAKVKEGAFEVKVSTTGELRAKKFVQVMGPANSNQVGVFQMKVSSIVPEGTVVKAGDMVAELDRSLVAARMTEVSLALQTAQAKFRSAQLDTAYNLANAREDIRNLELALEEKKIAKEQAVFEAPSVKRQTDLDYEKATRALAQAKRNYETKSAQAVATMSVANADVSRQQNQLNIVQDVQSNFTIKAPSPGMVIYVREWNGQKKGVGSQISAWDPTVATLPDLTQMESITYVNEIDVRKLAVGQHATITLDADPSKQLTGKVVSVANMGEQRPNADAKVFEVKLSVEQADTTLRPGMTTGNAILASTIKKARYVPLEAVMPDSGVPYVYRKRGTSIVRQEIETGAMNDDEIVVLRGLEIGDEVMLSAPNDKSGISTSRLKGAPVNKPAVTPPAPGTNKPTTPLDAPPKTQIEPAAAAPPTPAKATPTFVKP
jgi:RND family efflux transporter MFP subunit